MKISFEVSAHQFSVMEQVAASAGIGVHAMCQKLILNAVEAAYAALNGVK